MYESLKDALDRAIADTAPLGFASQPPYNFSYANACEGSKELYSGFVGPWRF